MPRERPWKSKTLMYRYYVALRMTEQEIADRLNTDQSTINRWLKRHELKK